MVIVVAGNRYAINAYQVIVQIIRHHLIAPVKIVPSLLTVAIAQHPKPTESDSIRINLDVRNEMQLLSRIDDQFKYKLRLFKEILDDFVFLLILNADKISSVEQAIGDLVPKLDEILASDVIPTVNMMKSSSSEWKNIAIVFANEKSQIGAQNNAQNSATTIQLLNRMKNLIKCSESWASQRTEIVKIAQQNWR